MQPAAIPLNESARIARLRSLQILDTLPEERFDRLTRLAKRMFGVPIALVSLVDVNRQWFKSHQGLDVAETPRDVSFCAHAILHDAVLEIPDARDDGRFFDNPLVTGNPGIRFYAGCPLNVDNGMRVGTLCLVDTEPRQLSDEDRALLQDLAKMVEQELASLHTATVDHLTGLSNRRGFEILSQHVLSLCERLRLPVTLMLLDVDHFKAINDTHGHAEGDQALAAFAEILRGTLRDSDVLARLGGDEFVALLSNVDAPQASVVSERLRQSFEQAGDDSTRIYELLPSIGCATVNEHTGYRLESLLQAADGAMYQNKRARRARMR
ncbi:GGDEF domain-containing protein [Bordetella genomosp. 9]|uniref:GGDEF domain-containing protein n=2 Tax=Bordetella genomosp. 9 TaxID=1416803 RepID=A0A261RN77_9BORD|nr:GGDEF domain-containing protein [Bordetella genomosp. 9]